MPQLVGARPQKPRGHKTRGIQTLRDGLNVVMNCRPKHGVETLQDIFGSRRAHGNPNGLVDMAHLNMVNPTGFKAPGLQHGVGDPFIGVPDKIFIGHWKSN